MKHFDLSQLSVGSDGRVELAEGELAAVEQEFGSSVAGAGRTNAGNCSGTTNGGCMNTYMCSGSSNDFSCGNGGDCGGTHNLQGHCQEF